MMFNRFYNTKMMNTSASAPRANADTSCAYTAHSANHTFTVILDAIIMASIIIYGLITILGLRLITLLAVLVLVVGLVICKLNLPWFRESAI